MRELPDYLRPLPGPNDAAGAGAAAAPSDHPAEESGTPGLIPPINRGHAGGFITDAIVQLGYASQEEVDQAVMQSRTAGKRPEEVLLEQGTIDSEQLSRATAERYGLDFVDLSLFSVDMGAANLISVKSARRHGALPISYVDESTLLLAMADPTNVLALDDVQMATGMNCAVAVAPYFDIEGLITKLGTMQNTVADAIADGDEGEGAEQGPAEITDIRASAEDGPVIKLVNSILGQAVAEGASDIHFEPEEGEMRIRFRVDGVLQETARVPKRMVAGVISRVKIMSELDIAEKRVPQDGRVTVRVDDRRIDLRVTTLPTQGGEGASVRILDEAGALRTLDDLGMEGEARLRFEESFRKPYGAVLVTGPTGAGKSSTLYAALQDINDVNRHIVTIEDPVEFRLTGVNQIGVNRKAGLTFATGLRSVLRADPDVIMVGEIRDTETAMTAIESSLTGHLILSTLHTNDAASAVTRLVEMGVEPFLVASSITCVVAQRLARALCEACKEPVTITTQMLQENGFEAEADIEAFGPVGCVRCGSTGYRGRIGMFEVMRMSQPIRELVLVRSAAENIGEIADGEGMRRLHLDGIDKVKAGQTSFAEVLRVTAAA